MISTAKASLLARAAVNGRPCRSLQVLVRPHFAEKRQQDRRGGLGNRRFHSTQPAFEEESPDLALAAQDAHLMLILGKPGGGKGTICNKILKVCTIQEAML
jgi:hypothetical protein